MPSLSCCLLRPEGRYAVIAIDFEKCAEKSPQKAKPALLEREVLRTRDFKFSPKLEVKTSQIPWFCGIGDTEIQAHVFMDKFLISINSNTYMYMYVYRMHWPVSVQSTSGHFHSERVLFRDIR